jgi:hypothetical protein
MLSLLLAATLAATSASQTILIVVMEPEVVEATRRDTAARTTETIDTETPNTMTECSGEVCTWSEV